MPTLTPRPSGDGRSDHLSDELLDDLLRLAPAPCAAPLGAEALDRLERSLVDALRADAAPAPRSGVRERARRWAPSALVPACGAALVALVVVMLTTAPAPGGAEPLPVRADPAAAAALDGLADAALVASTPAVADDQFVYVRSMALTNEGTWAGGVELGDLHEREIWLSQSASEGEGLIREFGQDWPLADGGFRVAAGPGRPTYDWAAGLPADPDEIVAELARHRDVDSPLSEDQYVFERIGDLITEGLAPPRLAHALLGAVTKLSGVVLVERTQDAVGRAGFGISRVDEFSGVATTWVFQPGSAAPIGVRWTFTDAAGSGTLFGATAVLERGVADVLGEPPSGRPGA